MIEISEDMVLQSCLGVGLIYRSRLVLTVVTVPLAMSTVIVEDTSLKL